MQVGAYFIDEDTSHELHYIHEGYSGQQGPACSTEGGLFEVARTWYETAIKELERSNFFSKPQISTVKALGILNLLHRNFGETHREYFLLGLAISVARTLGLDHLPLEGDNIQESHTPYRLSHRSDRELGRRLWWTLVICDW